MPSLVWIREGVFVGQGAKVRCFPSTDDIVLNTLHCTTVHASDTYIHTLQINAYCRYITPQRGRAPYYSIVTKIGRDVELGYVINPAKFGMDL